MTMENYIWYEKYRPQSLADLVLSEELRLSFDKFISDEQIPHLILYGSAGSGKTSIAKILISEIPCKSLTLNASKDRGIDVARNKIVDFAKSKSNVQKVIFLDEADNMTKDAQDSLKSTIEKYSSICKFIFTANDLSGLIAPIRSRGMHFEFSQFPVSGMVKKTCGILENEGITFDRRAVSTVVHRLYPDFRSIINTVQSASISGTFKLSAAGGANLKLSEFTDNLESGNLRAIRESLIGIQDFTFVYKFLFNTFLYKNIDDEQKPEAVQIIASHLANDSQVADREINMCSCLIGLMLLLEIKIKF